jgi:Fic family protein
MVVEGLPFASDVRRMTQLSAYSPIRGYVPRDESSRGRLLTRVRGEFIEMPGLKLTSQQAQRLWGLDRSICERVLSSLVREGFLEQTTDGGFKRTDNRRSLD